MKNIKFISFKNQIKKIFVFYSLVPIFIFSFIGYGTIYYFQYLNIKKDGNIKTIKVDENITILLNNYNLALDILSHENNISDSFLYNETSTDIKYFELIYNVKKKLNLKGNFYIFDKNLVPILYGTKFSEFNDNNNNLNWGLFKKLNNINNNIIIDTNKIYFENRTCSLLSLGKKIVINGEIKGYIVFYILEEEVENILKELKNINFILTDKNFYIISSSTSILKDSLNRLKQNIRNKNNYSIIDNESFYIIKKKNIISNLNLYTFFNLEFLFKQFSDGIYYVSFTFLISILVMLIVANTISVKKTEAVKTIVNSIRAIKKNNFSKFIKVDTNDEFKIIANSYNKMLLNIQNLIILNKKEVIHGIELEIKQLESQFNPHFLFNTLEMLRCTIKEDISMSNQIILNISSILRFGIENKSSEVPLKKDIEYTKSYLEIQKFRFEDDFSYSVKFSSTLDNYLIPKLIIQPIIENSIKYGFLKKEKLDIQIKYKIKNHDIVIFILDNGSGINKNDLKVIRERLKYKKLETEHIGLYNIHKRIQLINGFKYGIKILSSPPKRTLVKVVLPLKKFT